MFSRPITRLQARVSVLGRPMRSFGDIPERGADNIFIIRHGARLDAADPNWSAMALRPQDTPLSHKGLGQARRLGKWLYGRLPVNAPLAIFASPFIRCVQTADCIAEQLEGLQREGLHSSSATKICIEPGLCEDMSYMYHLKCQEPWFLNAADLVCASNRIDLGYKPLRKVTFERGANGYPGGCIETTPGGTEARCSSIALELADHPLVRDHGTALLITHGCPSTHMVKSLNPRPGGIHLPSYDEIKAGHYKGPPLQYTACTAMRRNWTTNTWDLAKGFKLFSNDHDPRLALAVKQKSEKVTRYVFAHSTSMNQSGSFYGPEVMEMEVAHGDLDGYRAGDLVKVSVRGHELQFTLPLEYRGGDTIRVKYPAPPALLEAQENDNVAA